MTAIPSSVTQFNWIDVTIVGVILVSVLISLIRGFVREALSLIIWAVAAYVSLTFADNFAKFFIGHIDSVSIRLGVSFIILFVLTLIAGAILSFVLSLLVEKTGLSGSDRLLGVIFGFMRGVLVVSVLILVVKLTNIPHDPMWQHSKLVPKFEPIEKWLQQFMDDHVKDYLPIHQLKKINSGSDNVNTAKRVLGDVSAQGESANHPSNGTEHSP